MTCKQYNTIQKQYNITQDSIVQYSTIHTNNTKILCNRWLGHHNSYCEPFNI